MHRYLPRVHIVQASDSYTMRTGPLSTFIFDETAFIAVTAYQNDQVNRTENSFDRSDFPLLLDYQIKNQ